MPLKRRAGKAAGKTTGRAGKVAGKLGAKAGRRVAPHVGRNAWRLGKAEAKLIQKAMSSREPRSSRYTKYAIFIAIGIGIGALLKRSASNGRQTWGSSDGGSPSDANRPGAERGYSSPSDGPLIGSGGGGAMATTGVPPENEEAEQRVRTALGEDDRTGDEPRINVAVTEGIAELRGPVSSDAVKQAAEEIAKNTEGVREVRNLLSVG